VCVCVSNAQRLDCITSLETVILLMMFQLEPKHVGECVISNNVYLHLPDNKCILLVFNEQQSTFLLL
jgi:hypothetical protein